MLGGRTGEVGCVGTIAYALIAGPISLALVRSGRRFIDPVDIATIRFPSLA